MSTGNEHVRLVEFRAILRKRMAVGRGYYWRRDECEAFADLLLASMRPARPAVRTD